MKIQVLLITLFLASISLFAQDENYTFLTDKKFRSPQDLIGYKFIPSEIEIPNEDKYELGAGEYSFGITRNNLYVQGEDIKGVYNVNNINTTEYGFKLALINARDPREQGHLKVILAGKYYVDALVFKKSNDEKELIFFLPETPDELFEADKAYYTDRTELELLEADSIWGTTIHPFFRIYKQGAVHERLQYSDSTWISFVEEINIVEKIKAPKKEKVKKEKKKKKKGAFNIETGLYEGEEPNTEEEEGEVLDETELEEEEEEDIVDVADEDSEDSELEEEIAVEKKIKITKAYFIDIRTNIQMEDGSIDERLDRYNVKKIKEREDETADATQERFQIEIETNKGLMYLYLTGRKTISSFEFGEERYLMRGH